MTILHLNLPDEMQLSDIKIRNYLDLEFQMSHTFA